MVLEFTNTDLVVRYLYLGTQRPFYIRKTQPLDIPLAKETLQTPLKNLIGVATARKQLEALKEATKKVLESKTTTGAASKDAVAVKKEAEDIGQAIEDLEKAIKSDFKEMDPVDILRKVLSSGTLWRLDESLFTIAYLARTLEDPSEKNRLYQLIPEYIKTSKDLFQFLFFYKTVSAKDNGKCCIGNGVKSALIKWYDKHTAEQLAQMFALERSWYGWSHKNVLVMIHMKLEDKAKMQVVDVATGGKGIARGPKKAESTDEKSSEEEQEQSEALLVYRRWKKFKSVNNANEACQGILEFNYPFQLVPTQLHRASVVWETILPKMPYRDVIKSSLALQDYKMLKDASRLTTIYGNAVNCMTAVKESKLHPVFIYQTMRLFEERQRYLNIVKEAVHSVSNLGLKNITANPAVIRHFYSALNESMLNYKRTNLNFFITLDLRTKHSRKTVFGNRLMSCSAAYVLCTLPILKREQFVRVMTFTEQAETLKDVDFTREMKFFDAFEHIQANSAKKTKVDIQQPLEYASKGKNKVDVFITIVDSLIRVNPQRTSPAERLYKYNHDKKANARYIIINLSRHTQDLNHQNDLKGVLELVGFNEDTPKLIDAYIHGCFN
ncbi:RNA-binding protein RO60-like [Uranotaenia lowii]|uniref:RNA-binding protein RO60-like n=1 Tax=Uranotaenia lowii TaxID=190385 RepID=UPI00247AB284|nr:RNA-binding protein RO60-like [Uranotaenia lowii]